MTTPRGPDSPSSTLPLAKPAPSPSLSPSSSPSPIPSSALFTLFGGARRPACAIEDSLVHAVCWSAVCCLSAVCCPLFVVWWSLLSGGLLFAVCLLSVVCCLRSVWWSSVCLLSVVLLPGCLLSAVHNFCLLSAVCCLAVCCLVSGVCCLSSLSAVCCSLFMSRLLSAVPLSGSLFCCCVGYRDFHRAGVCRYVCVCVKRVLTHGTSLQEMLQDTHKHTQ
jgi:hypothetical protein